MANTHIVRLRTLRYSVWRWLVERLWIPSIAELCKQFDMRSDRVFELNLISRWKWLGSIKQSDGGFEIAKGAEEDVR